MSVKLTEDHLRYMNLGKRYWSSKLQSLTREQQEALGAYPKNLGSAISSGVGLYLWGKNSTGKTYTAAALCIEATERFGISCYMVRAVELKEAWIQDFPANEGSEETVLWRIQNVRFLFIDDLGKEYRTSSGFSETNFGSLLRERSRKQLVTSLTTNINPDNFADSYGIASYELLRECTVPVALAGTNHRDKEFLKNQALLKG